MYTFIFNIYLSIIIIQKHTYKIFLSISILIFSFIGIEYLILKAFLIAIIATILEAISVKGLDNITVPLIITVIVANII